MLPLVGIGAVVVRKGFKFLQKVVIVIPCFTQTPERGPCVFQLNAPTERVDTLKKKRWG